MMRGIALVTPGSFPGVLLEARMTLTLHTLKVFLNCLTLPLGIPRPNRQRFLCEEELVVLRKYPIDTNSSQLEPKILDIVGGSQHRADVDQEKGYRQIGEQEQFRCQASTVVDLKQMLVPSKGHIRKEQRK